MLEDFSFIAYFLFCFNIILFISQHFVYFPTDLSNSIFPIFSLFLRLDNFLKLSLSLLTFAISHLLLNFSSDFLIYYCNFLFYNSFSFTKCWVLSITNVDVENKAIIYLNLKTQEEMKYIQSSNIVTLRHKNLEYQIIFYNRYQNIDSDGLTFFNHFIKVWLTNKKSYMFNIYNNLMSLEINIHS